MGGGVLHAGDDDDSVKVGGGLKADIFRKYLDGNDGGICGSIPARERGFGAGAEGFALRPFGSGFDPISQGCDISDGERFAIFFWRHAVVVICGEADAGVNPRFFQITGDKGFPGIARV